MGPSDYYTIYYIRGEFFVLLGNTSSGVGGEQFYYKFISRNKNFVTNAPKDVVSHEKNKQAEVESSAISSDMVSFDENNNSDGSNRAHFLNMNLFDGNDNFGWGNEF